MVSPSSPSFAVIVPHYNDPERLRRCLSALVDQVDEAGEIIVADNASPCDLSFVRAEFPTVRFVTQPQKGAGPARNKGVAETTAPWLLFIDADCVPAPDWVAMGRQVARAGTVIGGRVDVFHETPPPKSGAEAFEEVFAFKMRAYLERDAFLGAGNLVVPRDVFEAVGPFRPAVSEDKDWSQRAARAGFTLDFADDFAVSHPSRQDWAALAHKWRRLTVEAYLLRRSEGGGRVGWVVRALLMPASILAHLPRIWRAPDLSMADRLRASGTLVRIRLARMVWMIRQALSGQGEL